MKYTVFDPVTGAIKRSGCVSYDDVSDQREAGEGIIAGIAGSWETDRVAIINGIPTVVPIVKTLAEQKSALLARLAQRRWEVEVGGTEVGGYAIATDDRSKLMLTGAFMAQAANPEFSTNWKTGSGWVTIDAATIRSLYASVSAHVDRCFRREKEIGDSITAAQTVDGVEGIRAEVVDLGTSIGCSDDLVLNRRVGCEITEATPPTSWPVLKDTIVQRMKAQGLLPNLVAMVSTLSAEDRFEFDQSSWFTSNNPRIAAGISACGGDPISVLAFDPLA